MIGHRSSNARASVRDAVQRHCGGLPSAEPANARAARPAASRRSFRRSSRRHAAYSASCRSAPGDHRRRGRRALPIRGLADNRQLADDRNRCLADHGCRGRRLASRHIGSERSAREGERRNRGNEKLCHVIPPSPAVKNISKIDESALIHVNSELKRPHAQSDAFSAESALLRNTSRTLRNQ